MKFLSEQERLEIEAIAAERGQSPLEIVRECVQCFLAHRRMTKPDRLNGPRDSIRRILPKALPPTRSIMLDEYGCCCAPLGECPFRSDCAQHQSSGDFRSNDGIRPMLVKNMLGNSISCCTCLDSNRHLGRGRISKIVIDNTSLGQIVRSDDDY